MSNLNILSFSLKIWKHFKLFKLVFVLLFNFSDNDFKINEGDRIAQMIIEYVVETEVKEVEELDETQRGEGGFGSTGVKIWDSIFSLL